jgi:hypothetical protein
LSQRVNPSQTKPRTDTVTSSCYVFINLSASLCQLFPLCLSHPSLDNCSPARHHSSPARATTFLPSVYESFSTHFGRRPTSRLHFSFVPFADFPVPEIHSNHILRPNTSTDQPLHSLIFPCPQPFHGFSNFERLSVYTLY